MNVKKIWILEFWKAGQVQRWRTFEATPTAALVIQKVAQKSEGTDGCRVLLVLADSQHLLAA